MHVITRYDVGAVLHQNDLQCLHKFTACYIAIYHLLIKYIIFDTDYFANLHVNIAGQKYKNLAPDLVNECYVFRIINGQHLEDGHHIYHST